MIEREAGELRPYPTTGGHISGDGTYADAPTPPGIPESEKAELANEPEDDQ